MDLQEVILARAIVMDATIETQRLTRKEKKEYLMNKLRCFDKRVTPCGKFKYIIVVGSGDRTRRACRKGFCKVYGLSAWNLNDMIARLRNGDLNCDNIPSATHAINQNNLCTKNIEAFARYHGIELSHFQLGSLRLKSNAETMATAAWMQYYFELVGDKVPNRGGQIHLDPVPKKEVYSEYLLDMELLIKEPPISFQTFLRIWKQVYPHVKVRKFKTSCGKCNCCTELGEKRRKCSDRFSRAELTNLFALHRASVMGERRTYYERRLEAELNPRQYLSTISDGMQQNHCQLPWLAHMKMPPVNLKQHLQGVLMHGKAMTIYR